MVISTFGSLCGMMLLIVLNIDVNDILCNTSNNITDIDINMQISDSFITMTYCL